MASDVTASDPVFLVRFETGGTGRRVALKDLIDVRGTITTAGCREVARRSTPATADAMCLSGIRAAEARGEVQLVGKTGLHELAFGADGINAAYGTPTNPLDADRIPGGSSSGSAVAVANGSADIALGSDTGGSIRIPAACCGIVGLKTTFGRVPVRGTWPLAPFLDTIGPLARSVADAIAAMDLLEPGFAAATARTAPATVIGRVRPQVATDPSIDAAIDAALAASPYRIVDIDLAFWEEVHQAGLTVLLGEAWRTDGHLLNDESLDTESGDTGSLVSEALAERLRLGAGIDDDALREARAVRARGLAALSAVFEQVDLLALPVLPILPPLLDAASNAPLTAFTRFANMLGTPALALPIVRPIDSSFPHLPAGLQLVGPLAGEELLLATATRLG